MEAVIVIDTLRRAGLDVTVASVEDSLQVTASRNVKITADESIEQCAGPYDVIALPVRSHTTCLQHVCTLRSPVLAHPAGA